MSPPARGATTEQSGEGPASEEAIRAHGPYKNQKGQQGKKQVSSLHVIAERRGAAEFETFRCAPQQVNRKGETGPVYQLFKGWWCQMFHDEPMCPVNGVWQCRTCQTKFVVNFERDLRPPVPRQPPPPDQTLMEVSPQ